MNKFSTISFFLSLLACFQLSGVALAATCTVPDWRKPAEPQFIYPAGGAIYYSFVYANGVRIHLVVVDLKAGLWEIKPALCNKTRMTSACADEYGASAAVNGGYFNLTDGVSAGYIVIDGKQVSDPSTNQALVQNQKLKPFLPTIFNRSEVRFLQNERGILVIQIAAHNDPLPDKTILLNSLQAGPRLLPQLTGKEEAFVRQDAAGFETDGIGSTRPAARTAFGITPDRYAMLLCAAGSRQDPESHGLTLSELSALMSDLGCSEAINLDGGASTTMFIRQADDAPAGQMPAGRVVCGKDPETLVKSVLLLKHR